MSYQLPPSIQVEVDGPIRLVRLNRPDELNATEDETGQHGRMRVLDGTAPMDVSWHASRTVLGASDVRLIMVCPRVTEGLCRDLWRSMFSSVVRSP